MKNKYTYLINNTFIFFVGIIAPKILSFIMTPLYTKFLSTNQYGTVDLINTLVSLLIPILTLNINDALLRFLLDKDKDNNDVTNIVFNIFVKNVVILTILFVICFIFNPFNLNKFYYIYFYIYYIFNVLYNFLYTNLKCNDNVKIIMKSSIISSICSITINAVLIIIFKLSVIGYVIGNTFGTIVSCIYMIYKSKIYKNLKLKIDKKLKKEMLKYCAPLIFSSLAWWINSSSDKYLISLISGVSYSGIYAASNKIPNILKAFENVFNQAWSVSALKDYSENDEDGFLGTLFTMISFFLCLICSGIMIFNILLSKILFSGEFFIAWKNVPPLLVAAMFGALISTLNVIFYALKKTKVTSVITIFCAFINIGLNIVLITKYNIYGAALATLISYIISYTITLIILKRYINIKTNSLINYISYILLLIQVFLAYYGNKYILIECIIPLLIILLYIKNIKTFIIFIKNNYLEKIMLLIKGRKIKK